MLVLLAASTRQAGNSSMNTGTMSTSETRDKHYSGKLVYHLTSAPFQPGARSRESDQTACRLHHGQLCNQVLWYTGKTSCDSPGRAYWLSW